MYVYTAGQVSMSQYPQDFISPIVPTLVAHQGLAERLVMQEWYLNRSLFITILNNT